jgi:hypothetical protein
VFIDGQPRRFLVGNEHSTRPPDDLETSRAELGATLARIASQIDTVRTAPRDPGARAHERRLLADLRLAATILRREATLLGASLDALDAEGNPAAR